MCSLVGTARENYYHKASKTQTCAGRKVHEKPSGDWTPESDLFGWCVGVPNQLPGSKVIIGPELVKGLCLCLTTGCPPGHAGRRL